MLRCKSLRAKRLDLTRKPNILTRRGKRRVSGRNVSTRPSTAKKNAGLIDLTEVQSEQSIWGTIFWRAHYLVQSSWTEHIPFAFWAIAALQPRLVAELGTKYGTSYFSFCQAIERLGTQSRSFSVDHWKGDEHTGTYGEEVFAQVESYNRATYSSFSTLLRMSFDEAAELFEPGTIDLLHIDGLHTEPAVRHDFETWLPKLSNRGVLLLHDTNVRDRGFGVYKLFNELARSYPTFEFFHGHGLGVVGIGADQEPNLQRLFDSANNKTAAARLRETFSRLGRGHLDRSLLEAEKHQRKKDRQELHRLAEKLEQSIDRERQAAEKLQALQNQLEQEIFAHQDARELGDELRDQLALRDRALEDKKNTIAELDACIAGLKADGIRSYNYFEKVKSDLVTRRDSIVKKVARIVQKRELAGDVAAARTNAIFRNALVPGSRSALTTTSSILDKLTSRAQRNVQQYYSKVCGRGDAADLALIATSGFFDPTFYLKEYKDVAEAAIDPLIHYVDYGAAEDRNPSPLFNTKYYVKTTPEGLEKRINPLLHYLKHGMHEGRSPRPVRPLSIDLGEWFLPPWPTSNQPAASRNSAKRTVIYTAVTGGYDNLRPPQFRPPGCDFVVFSDQALDVEGWKVRPLNYFHPDPTRAARFVKMHPHIYFPEYEQSVWVDANIGIAGDLRELFDRLPENAFLGMFIHPHRNCVYMEGEECIKRKKDDPHQINQQLARYREALVPKGIGLFETGLIVRRHNDQACIGLMTAWWRELETGSRRDQLSLPVVAREQSVQIAPLASAGEDLRHHPLLDFVEHRADRLESRTGLAPAVTRKNLDLDSISVTVGVCVYNSLEETKSCLESVIKCDLAHAKLLIIDDASNLETANYLDEFAKAHECVRLIRHEQNEGYTRSANDALRNSDADWTVLLNSDTIVPPCAIRKIVACGEQFSQIGIVGPLSNAASWQTVPQLNGNDGKFLVNDIPAGLTVDDMDRICENLAIGPVPFVPLVNGFCYAVHRRVLNSIGLLDIKSFPMGYGEEDDLSLRAGAAGFLCAIATDAYVYHSKSASFTPERREVLVKLGAVALRIKHSPERVAAAVHMLRSNPELARVRDRIFEQLCPNSYSEAVRARAE